MRDRRGPGCCVTPSLAVRSRRPSRIFAESRLLPLIEPRPFSEVFENGSEMGNLRCQHLAHATPDVCGSGPQILARVFMRITDIRVCGSRGFPLLTVRCVRRPTLRCEKVYLCFHCRSEYPCCLQLHRTFCAASPASERQDLRTKEKERPL